MQAVKFKKTFMYEGKLVKCFFLQNINMQTVDSLDDKSNYINKTERVFCGSSLVKKTA